MISKYRRPKHPGGTVIKLNIPETWGIDRSTPNSLIPPDRYVNIHYRCVDSITFSVDWGDGTAVQEINHTKNEVGDYSKLEHTYSKGGTYSIELYGINNHEFILGSGTRTVYSGYDSLDSCLMFDPQISDYYQLLCNCLVGVVIGDGISTASSFHESANGKVEYYEFNPSKDPSDELFNEYWKFNKIPNIFFQYNYACDYVEIPEYIQHIGNNAFSYSKFSTIKLNEGLKSIGTNAFRYFYMPLGELTLPSTVETIGSGAFSYNYGTYIYKFDFSKTKITVLNSDMFVEDSGLQEILLPHTLTSIGSNVCKNCSSLRRITCLSMVAPTLSTSSFTNMSTWSSLSNLLELCVPKGATGYDTGEWKTQLLDKGWKLKYI